MKSYKLSVLSGFMANINMLYYLASKDIVFAVLSFLCSMAMFYYSLKSDE